MKYILLLAMLGVVACKGEPGLNGADGKDGKDGKDGVDGTTVSIQPFCPSIAGVIGHANRESYLVIGSSVYAVYYDGSHTFLSLLNPGSYVTTDGRNCHFTVTAGGQVL